MPLIEEKNRINPSGEVGTITSKTFTQEAYESPDH